MNDVFIKKIIALRGNKGKKWLDDLPQIIQELEKEWDITVFAPFPLSYNYVAPAKTIDGKPVVLKISFPDNNEFISEIEALKFFNGQGAIQVIREDREKSVVLLEKAETGQRVREVTPEKQQIHIVTEVIKLLHKPILVDKHTIFPTVANWGKAFDRYKAKYHQFGPVPQWMVDKGAEIFKEYTKEKNKLVLLHGDLHSDNILSSQRGWLAIDPKGVIGEPEFELGAYLRNPVYDYIKGSNYKKVETGRILQFAEELSFDKERLRGWAFACAVISLLWYLEDEEEFNEIYVQNAELINDIRF